MFTIPGTPIPQGSKTLTRQGKLIEANPKHRAWQTLAIHTARKHRPPHPINTGITVSAEFVFTPPQRGKPGQHKTTKPDLDKLQRNLGDALEKAGIITNDSRIHTWHTTKTYNHTPCTHVTIHPDH